VPVVADSPEEVAAAHMHRVVHIDSEVADHNHPAHCTYKTKTTARNNILSFKYSLYQQGLLQLTIQVYLSISVHIITQWANRYIQAFQIAISYDYFYLPGSGSQVTQTVCSTLGELIYTEVTGLRMRPLADADLQNF